MMETIIVYLRAALLWPLAAVGLLPRGDLGVILRSAARDVCNYNRAIREVRTYWEETDDELRARILRALEVSR